MTSTIVDMKMVVIILTVISRLVASIHFTSTSTCTNITSTRGPTTGTHTGDSTNLST